MPQGYYDPLKDFLKVLLRAVLMAHQQARVISLESETYGDLAQHSTGALRLVQSDSGPGGSATYHLVHDSLGQD
jgi:hypothetical protein